MCLPLLLMMVMASARAPIDEPAYCSLRYRRLCQGKGQHVACQFPLAGPAETCLNYTVINFTPDLAHLVTHYINRRRQRIAAGHERLRGGATLPRPQIMMFVVWDRELALLAQRLADQCHFVHDECRATVRFPYAGQTVGEVRWRRGAGAAEEADEARQAVRRVLDAWWGERRRVDPAHLVRPFTLTRRGNSWGHFSQLAVWSLRAAGCGGARHGGSSPRLLLVCDFSHTNMLGQRTLSPGPPAPCPEHTARRPRTPYPLLCAPVAMQASTTEAEEAYNDYYEEGSRRPVVRINNVPPEQKNIILPIHKLHKELGNRGEPARKSSGLSRARTQTIPTRSTWEEKAYTESGSESRDPSLDEVIKFTRHRKTTTAPRTIRTRQKWQSPRKRPHRPGADALLYKNSEKRPQFGKSLTLDDEDLEQLYLDTGFKLNKWRKTFTIED